MGTLAFSAYNLVRMNSLSATGKKAAIAGAAFSAVMVLGTSSTINRAKMLSDLVSGKLNDQTDAAAKKEESA